MNQLFKISLFVVMLFSSLSCNNRMRENELGVMVDLTIDLNLPEFFELTTIGGFTYIIGGFQGIIVRRNSPDEFVAFDRQCPVDPEAICRLEADPSGLFAANDECCSASFTLFDGNITDGVSPRGMYRYQCFFNFSTNQLRITN